MLIEHTTTQQGVGILRDETKQWKNTTAMPTMPTTAILPFDSHGRHHPNKPPDAIVIVTAKKAGEKRRLEAAGTREPFDSRDENKRHRHRHHHRHGVPKDDETIHHHRNENKRPLNPSVVAAAVLEGGGGGGGGGDGSSKRAKTATDNPQQETTDHEPLDEDDDVAMEICDENKKTPEINRNHHDEANDVWDFIGIG